MKTLVVGGNSSLAGFLKPRLSAFSEVLTAGRSGCDITIDLSSRLDALVLPKDIDVVINTASHFGGKSAEAVLMAAQINVQAPLALCEAAVRAGVRHVVQVSSIFALLQASSPFHNVYALTKRQSDELLQLFCATAGLPLAIVRPSQFVGAGEGTRRHQPFFTSLIEKAAGGKDIDLFGTHNARRNFIHVADVAEVVARVVQQGVTGTFACQYPEDIGYAEIASAAAQAFGSGSQVRFLADKPNTLDNVMPIDTSLYELIGFRPGISIEKCMQIEAGLRSVAS